MRYIDPSGHIDWGFWEDCFGFCADDDPQPATPPPPPPTVNQVVSQYQFPSVSDYVRQTSEMTMGFNAPSLYGTEFNAAYKDVSGGVPAQFSSSAISGDLYSLDSDRGSSLLNYLQAALGATELVPAPIVSTPASVLNATISGFRGDLLGAGASGLGVIPFAGIVGM